MQERDDLLILHSLATDFMTDLMNPDPPAPQYLALAVRDVLIQNVHKPADSVTNSGT